MDRDRIGKYEILGELGRGTMGEVYRALDPVLHRQVALKTLSVQMTPSDPEARDRFMREARAAAGLNHPNIVTIHDFGQDGEVLYMAMELLEGTDLRDTIDRDSVRELDDKLAVMDAVLAGLDYAHARGVIHRDIKPANIHLGPDGQVKIMDFGLARVNTSEMTQDGIVVGTPNYMSPEQALGEKVDGRSDLFSTGAVLYELLTGHKPFEADSTPSVLFQVVHREPPQVKRWNSTVPDPIVAVVDRSLVKDRDRRFASAAEMRDALLEAGKAAREGRSVALPEGSGAAVRSPSSSAARSGRTARRRTRGRTRRAPLVLGLVGTALAVAALGVGTTLWLRSRPPVAPTAAPSGSDRQVGELTRALVATQLQLAQRELEDKNWNAAAVQAESALRLAPGHPEATRVLEEARTRLGELDTAISAARSGLAAGDTEAASRELSHVLELDPRHPAAAELSARLNDVFRSEADAAAASMRAARDDARAAGAARSRDFAAANAVALRAEQLTQSEEYADAARTFLEARDAFDRAGRAARAAPAPREPSEQQAAEQTRGATPGAGARNAPTTKSATTVAVAGRPAPIPSPSVPPRVFQADQTTVTTPSAGELPGFETEDVRTRREPRFTGHMEFEVLPPEVRPGEPFVVRVHLVNEGNESIRIRGVELATVEGGQRTPTQVRPLRKEVPKRSRALVAEYSSTWSAEGPWALEAVVSADDNEKVRSRLTSN